MSRDPASPLAGRDVSWSLAVGPRGPRADVILPVVGLVPDTAGCRVQGILKLVLAWLVDRPGPAGPNVMLACSHES